MPALPLRAGEAYLWYLRLAATESPWLPWCLWLLSPEEHRQQRSRHGEVRRQYVGARALTRYALSMHGTLPPAAWSFRYGPLGKPEVAEPPEGPALRFSVSHGRGLVACLVALVDAGVDVEPIDRRLSAAALAGSFFTAVEAVDLAATPEDRRRGRFVELWCQKEAYLKARGVGLAGRLNDLSACAAGGRRSSVGLVGDDPSRWHMRALAFPPGYVTAYALCIGDGPPVHVRICELSATAAVATR